MVCIMYVHIYDNCRSSDLTAAHIIGNLGPGDGDYRVVKPDTQLRVRLSWPGR